MFKQPENYIVISTYFDKEGKEITWSSTHEIRNLEDAFDCANEDHDGSEGHTYIYQLEKEPCVILSRPDDKAEDLYSKSNQDLS